MVWPKLIVKKEEAGVIFLIWVIVGVKFMVKSYEVKL